MLIFLKKSVKPLFCLRRCFEDFSSVFKIRLRQIIKFQKNRFWTTFKYQVKNEFSFPCVPYLIICNYKNNYVSCYSHIFYVYPYFKFAAIKRTVSFYSHIFLVYSYFKICNYKKRNYENNETHISIISHFRCFL